MELLYLLYLLYLLSALKKTTGCNLRWFRLLKPSLTDFNSRGSEISCENIWWRSKNVVILHPQTENDTTVSLPGAAAEETAAQKNKLKKKFSENLAE